MTAFEAKVKQAVRERYARAARTGAACGCAPPAEVDVAGVVAPSLGCGTPLAHAQLAVGEVVVDLGSGAGLDCLRAAKQVGPRGQVVGVDMTPEMVERARANAAALGLEGCRFLVAEVESLPLPDGFADVVVSNCVLNLVPDKARAIREAYRVLKPGGRLVVSDVVARVPLPPDLRADLDAWSACVGGAVPLPDFLDLLSRAGFLDVEVVASEDACCGQASPVQSVTVRARRPR